MVLIKACNPTWTILYKKEKTSETLAFFLDVATTVVMLRILATNGENQSRVENIIPTVNKLLWSNQCAVHHKDTVEVIVFDPHEANSPMGQDRREGPLLLFVHQKGHEVLDL